MTGIDIDPLFWAIAAATAAFVLLFPNAFLYLASYGGRLDYKPSPGGVLALRICAAVMLFGILADIVW